MVIIAVLILSLKFFFFIVFDLLVSFMFWLKVLFYKYRQYIFHDDQTEGSSICDIMGCISLGSYFLIHFIFNYFNL